MIDHEKIIPIIEGYKKHFSEHWKDEKYKWEAVKHFQDNWDIDAENFGEMFKKATAKASNLLESFARYPRTMILNFAKADDKTTREMFADLFDESRDLAERIKAFMQTADELKEKYNDGTRSNHFQNTNAVSTYLWLKYPDKYYIYMYDIYRKCAEKLDDTYRPKGNGDAANVIGGYKMYDEIREILLADQDIRKIFSSALTDTCYKDPEFVTAVIDFGYFLAKYYDESSISKDKRYWLCAPGNGACIWEECIEKGIIAIGWDAIGDLRQYGSKGEMKQRMKETINSDSSYKNAAHATWQFVNDMKPGDIVFAKKGLHLIVGRGVVGSEYIFDDSRQHYKNVRKVKWTHIGEWEHPGPAAMKTLTDITPYTEYVDKLNALFENAVVYDEDEMKIEYPPYTKSDFLKEVFMTEGEYDRLRALVLRKKNVILQGAPGVGKTFSAKRLAYSIIGEKNKNRICMVQFHQNYSYEDFIMGYRPNDSGGFDLQTGVFYDFCERCRENPDKPYFFIIDEINRGNLSKIFGELLMLIENDKRGEENKINLVYGGKPFYIPENLHMIGMMNTADRSLAMIDYALRRRFCFYTMRPAFEDAQRNGFGEYTKNIGCELYHKVIAKIKDLNAAIRSDSALGSGFEIGHSYFAPEDTSVINDEWVRGVVEFEIIPLIEEYWFDDHDSVNKWTDALHEASGDSNDS